MKKEIEVKIKLDKSEVPALKNKVKEAGGKNFPAQKETTYGFFTEDDSSIRKGIFPRIKSINDGEKAVFTVKVKKLTDNNYFQRDEYEMAIKDVELMREIIKALGFLRERIFEKIREKWLVDNGEVEINFDSLPFGDYIEIEGHPEKIEKWLRILGLDKRERITKAYLAVFDDWRKEHRVEEENAVFDE